MVLPIHNGNSDEANAEMPSTSLPTPHNAPPLDLSFKCLMTPAEILEDMDIHFQENLRKSRITNKYACNSVRLNNNSINDLGGFVDVLSTIVENLDDIAWIDLSFNELTSVDPILTEFKNLKVLYLHGNTIDRFHEINKLSLLPKLISLTLHGNPIETERGYRQYVLTNIPQLKTLDFGPVTKQDRSTAETWNMMNGKTFQKKRKKIKR